MPTRPPPSANAASLHTARPTDTCPYCGGKRIIRKGVRRNKYGDVQLFYCHHCQKKFTPLVTKHKSFPLRVILDALSLYNRLHTLEEAAAAVTEKYGISVSRQMSETGWRALRAICRSCACGRKQRGASIELNCCWKYGFITA
jgi:transposase-like protein